MADYAAPAYADGSFGRYSNRGVWNEGCSGGGRRVRKFADAEASAPPPKRRRNPYSSSGNSRNPKNPSGGGGGSQGISVPVGFGGLFGQARGGEDQRLCVPSLVEDRNGNCSKVGGGGGGEIRHTDGNVAAAAAAASSSEEEDIYYSREAIERHSPSRRDGIDSQKETILRFSYVCFLQTLGMRMQVPQTTIATAIVLCHRFFLRRSHASHDRYLIATACMFLVAKSEETPRPLNTVLLVSYELCHSTDLSTFHYLLPNDWFEQYKQRVLDAEKMILTTLNFELSVNHPYGPLLSVLNKLGLAQSALVHLAWNLITEGLRSSLCLQFKPQHIAAGAVFLAAEILNFDLSRLPLLWQEFQASTVIIQDVVKQIAELF